MSDLWSWVALALLGAYHGINPAMGWLFAVALGLQERRRRAVWLALFPITLGHALAILLTILALALARIVIAPGALALVCATVLFSFGLYRIIRSSHPRWVGMRVGFRDLTFWSFLMATAHGAGLMLVPVLLNLLEGGRAGHAPHAHNFASLAGSSGPVAMTELLAVGVHTGAMFAAMAVTALLVYDRIGLSILRKAWFNLDLLWAVALLAAGGMIALIHFGPELLPSMAEIK